MQEITYKFLLPIVGKSEQQLGRYTRELLGLDETIKGGRGIERKITINEGYLTLLLAVLVDDYGFKLADASHLVHRIQSEISLKMRFLMPSKSSERKDGLPNVVLKIYPSSQAAGQGKSKVGRRDYTLCFRTYREKKSVQVLDDKRGEQEVNEGPFLESWFPPGEMYSGRSRGAEYTIPLSEYLAYYLGSLKALTFVIR